jgi:hypothetical protein
MMIPTTIPMAKIPIAAISKISMGVPLTSWPAGLCPADPDLDRLPDMGYRAQTDVGN